MQANVVEGKIYLIGGYNPDVGYNQGYQLTNTTQVYDPTSDTWTTKAPMPNTVASVSTVINDKIYLIGSGITQIYDRKTDQWRIGKAAPNNITGLNEGGVVAIVTIGVMAPKYIYVYDGSTFQVYNPENETWTLGANPSTSRQHGQFALVNDTLFLIGGFTDHSNNIPGYYAFFDNNEQYIPFGYGTIASSISSYQDLIVIVVGLAIIIVAAAVVVIVFRKRI